MTHRLWFVFFMKPKTYSSVVSGGTLATIPKLCLSILQKDQFIFFNLLVSLIFILMSISLYFFAKTVLRKFEEFFSATNSSLMSLFASEDNLANYLQHIRASILSKKEYFFSLGIPILLIVGWAGSTVASEMFWQSQSIVNAVLTCYSGVYWGFVISLCLSFIWLISGITMALYNLGKQKGNLTIYKAIEDFGNIIQGNATSTSLKRLDAISLSFGKLKDGLHPLGEFVFGLAIRIAVIGFIISIPAMVSYISMGLVSDLSTYLAFCIFTGVFSLAVFTVAQLGTLEIWNSAKGRAIIILEQLLDKIRSDCINSLLTSSSASDSWKKRERMERDVNFVRSMIEDLRKLEVTRFNLPSVGRVSLTVLFPFIVLIFSKLIS